MVDLLGLDDSVLWEYLYGTNLGVIIRSISLARSTLVSTFKDSCSLEGCRLVARGAPLEPASLDNLAKSYLAKGTYSLRFVMLTFTKLLEEFDFSQIECRQILYLHKGCRRGLVTWGPRRVCGSSVRAAVRSVILVISFLTTHVIYKWSDNSRLLYW